LFLHAFCIDSVLLFGGGSHCIQLRSLNSLSCSAVVPSRWKDALETFMKHELRISMRNVMQARWHSGSPTPFEFERVMLAYTWQDLDRVRQDLLNTHAFSMTLAECGFEPNNLYEVELVLQNLLGLMQYRAVVLSLSGSLSQLHAQLTCSRRTVSLAPSVAVPELPSSMRDLASNAQQVSWQLSTYAGRLLSLVDAWRSTIRERGRPSVLGQKDVQLLLKLLDVVSAP
jgi:hypothetical protein